MMNLLLISDLDGTWLPSPGREADLLRLEAAVASSPHIHLAFATGRTLPAALEALDAVGSKGPQTLITDVGCALHRHTPSAGWKEDSHYRGLVQAQWNEVAAERVMKHLPKGVSPQPGVAARLRLALQVDPGFDPQERANPLAVVLESEGLVARILPSHGFYLDVLPIGVDKGFALRFLRDELGGCQVISCGDSENDLDLFRAADIAFVMSQHHLEEGQLDGLLKALIRCTEPGPAGIFAELTRLGHL